MAGKATTQNELLTVAHMMASNGGVVVTYRDATEVEYLNSFSFARDYSMRNGISKIILGVKQREPEMAQQIIEGGTNEVDSRR